MKQLKIVTILLPLLIFVLLETLLIQPVWFYYLLATANVLVVGLVYYFARGAKLNKIWWHLLILPIIILNSGWFYASLISIALLIHILFVVIVGTIYFYFRFLKAYAINPEKRYEDLESLVFFLSFLTIFFATAALFGLKTFLSLSAWVPILWLIPIMWLTIYQMFWFHQIKVNTRLIFTSILSLALTEIVVAVSFLPLAYDILALILAIFFYLSTGLSLAYLRNQLTNKILKMYVIFASLSLVLIFLTSRWM